MLFRSIDYYRGFDHGVNFVIVELRRLAREGDITIEKLMKSVDPQWEDAKQSRNKIALEMRSGRTREQA